MPIGNRGFEYTHTFCGFKFKIGETIERVGHHHRSTRNEDGSYTQHVKAFITRDTKFTFQYPTGHVIYSIYRSNLFSFLRYLDYESQKQREKAARRKEMAEIRKKYKTNDRPRDSQRSKVYDSENILKRHAKQFHSQAEVEAFIKTVTESSLWNEMASGSPCSRHGVKVDWNSRKRSWAHAYYGLSSIEMPGNAKKYKWAYRDYIVLHEMAHLVTPRNLPSHGNDFCANYLKLVRKFMGKKEADALKASFKKHGVKYTASRK